MDAPRQKQPLKDENALSVLQELELKEQEQGCWKNSAGHAFRHYVLQV